MGANDPASNSNVIPLYHADGCARYGAGAQTCRWKCGNQCAHPAPNQTPSDTFENVMRRFVSRRSLIRGAAAAGVTLAVAAPLGESTAATQSAEGALTFQEIALGTKDFIVVPPGYASDVLIRWGDPLFDDSPPFDPGNPSAAAAARQFGYNNDWIGFFPLPGGNADQALLAVNHEYTNPEIMFPGYDSDGPTKAQVDHELAAHGLTVVEIERAGGAWSYVVGAPLNRRVTGETEIQITGPAAGHAWLQTSDDPSGTRVRGMLNNCSGGQTPWGTILTAEENFNQYFANNDRLDDGDPRKATHKRYGLTAADSERKWETFYRRFDLAQEPNEPFRFGWMVEIDPTDPTSTPKKRTALGRFKHEGATFITGTDGRVGVYMGDDERFDYMYKFVTAGAISASNRAANADLLDRGTLYAAKFNDDGTGEWIPLVQGQGTLTEANGFLSQADVLIRAREAGDAAGATKMDRPEDIEFNPVNKKLYAAMTNNTNRTAAQVDKANPRARNTFGHIIELRENGDNPTATRFTWSIFMLCGRPQTDADIYFAGYPTRDLAPISSPDNLVVDRAGNLWILTDGQPGTINVNDTVYAVPTEGPERGRLKPFLSGVLGAETASGILSADNETLFVSIQHPGEGGTLDEPVSTWPDGTNMPRPSVVMAWKAAASGERRIGS
ncbi:MAG: PhoX family phosphatase [Dehalococcoidia bacterium]